MSSDTQFWRLVWKEYRIQRSLWLALLIATPVLQVLLMLLNWFNQDFRPLAMSDGLANGLMAMGFVASVVYLLGCCATMFSVEHETGVFDFQRVLPTNPPRVFWAKVGFAFVSSVALTVVLWIVTRGVFLWDGARGSTWFGTYGLLYMAEVFGWSILASLLIRQPLWGVIAAIALQSMTMQIVLPSLTSGRNDVFNLLNEDGRFTLSRCVVLALLLVADVMLGRLWFEDRLRLPSWRFRWKPDFVPSYPSDVELPLYSGQRQIGWSRLLWLSWRDGRWVITGVLAWYGYNFLTMRVPNDWGLLAWISFFGCFVFGLFAFAPEQWGGRFRYLTEHGCSPRIMWLCRQILWLPPIALLCLITSWKGQQANATIQLPPDHRAILVMGATIIPWLCYSAGQLTAMLFRSTAMAIGVGMGLCIVGGMWGIWMTSWLAPTWWTVGSLPAIGLFVTWLKANDWVEERRDRIARWRTALGLGVPIALLLASCATYRVVQIPVVTLPREWDETSQVLARLTPAEKETLAIYRRVLTEIEKGDDTLETYGQRRERLKREHTDWTDQQVHAESFAGFHRDWLALHAELVPLLREAHRMPPIPLALLETEPNARTDDWNPERTAMLPWLMMRQAEQSLREDQLDRTWDDILVAFELQRRFDQRAAPPKDLFSRGMGSVQESYLLQTVVKWGRHKDQTRDRIVTAIRKLEELATGREATERVVHLGLLESEAILNSDERWKKYAEQNPSFARHRDDEVQLLWTVGGGLPWEHWRSQRVVRFQAWMALNRMQQYQIALKWNVSMDDLMVPLTWRVAVKRLPAGMPEADRDRLLAMNPYDPYSADLTMLRMTLLPPNLLWDRLTTVESPFWQRAETFRVTTLLLALADFHREQGRSPAALDELAPAYFAEIPRDPKSAGPFRYFPNGLRADVTRGSVERGDFYVVVRKEVPFLVTNTGHSQMESSQKPDGTWEFKDHSGKLIELPVAFGGHGLRIWPVEEP